MKREAANGNWGTRKKSERKIEAAATHRTEKEWNSSLIFENFFPFKFKLLDEMFHHNM